MRGVDGANKSPPFRKRLPPTRRIISDSTICESTTNATNKCAIQKAKAKIRPQGEENRRNNEMEPGRKMYIGEIKGMSDKRPAKKVGIYTISHPAA
jgi:hypothetical protein